MYSKLTMTDSVDTIGCVKAATEILGDKWTPQLLRFFANNKVVRFCQLQDLVGGINPRTLSARLVSLEESNVVRRIPSDHSSRCEYELTKKGKALIPILRDMQAWSEQYA
jgi:DNA-binding HxlR family transcriptional regulator